MSAGDIGGENARLVEDAAVEADARQEIAEDTMVALPAAIVEVEINLTETARKLVRGRWLIAITTLLGLVLSAAYAYSLKPYFVSEAVFLPPKVASAAPAALIIGGTDPSDLYLALIASRSVLDDVIDRMNLMKVLGAKDRTTARLSLAGMTAATVTRNSLIEVKVTSGDPELAAKIANTYLEALYDLNGRMVASASTYRRQFFEAQLEEQKNVLAEAEVALAQTQKRTGVSPTSEAQTALNATASLDSAINAAETRLAGLLTSETEQNPEVVTARSQLAQLREQLVRQQAGSTARGSGLPSNGSLPELSLEYTQRAREVKLREAVFNNLVEEYERARMASIDPGPQLQVVDRAIPAERKSGPSRKNIMIVGILLGLVSGVAYILFNGPLRRLLGFLRESARTAPGQQGQAPRQPVRAPGTQR